MRLHWPSARDVLLVGIGAAWPVVVTLTAPRVLRRFVGF